MKEQITREFAIEILTEIYNPDPKPIGLDYTIEAVKALDRNGYIKKSDLEIARGEYIESMRLDSETVMPSLREAIFKYINELEKENERLK